MVKKLHNVQQKYIDSLHLDSIFTKRLAKSRKVVMVVAADTPPPSDITLYITRFLFQTNEYSAVDKYLFTTLSRIVMSRNVMSRNVMSRIVCVTNCLSRIVMSRIVMSRIVCIPLARSLHDVSCGKQQPLRGSCLLQIGTSCIRNAKKIGKF